MREALISIADKENRRDLVGAVWCQIIAAYFAFQLAMGLIGWQQSVPAFLVSYLVQVHEILHEGIGSAPYIHGRTRVTAGPERNATAELRSSQRR